jgi:hypothetical protein
MTPEQLAREARSMTRVDVIKKALEGRINWVQAATVLGITSRHLYRLRLRYEQFGIPGVRDKRSGRRMPMKLAREVVEEVCRLRQEHYADFSIRHFHQFAMERHGLRLSYTLLKTILQARGLAPKARGRGKYRRRRERRPMRGMLIHLDASTHTWIAGIAQRDLVVALDDADGRILYARFVEQEGTMSTLAALRHVVVRYGRFGELYTDRGSHFCRTSEAGGAPDELQHGQVARVLKVLGIHHILARSPEARGRSERAFGTIQGRLPQELRLAKVGNYEAANQYLDEVFVPDFNRRFTVEPAEPESAFVRLVGLDLNLQFSIQHQRIVRGDSTVTFGNLSLQLPKTRERRHYARCPVLVHEFLDGTLGVSYQNRLIARFTAEGLLLPSATLRRVA